MKRNRRRKAAARPSRSRPLPDKRPVLHKSDLVLRFAAASLLVAGTFVRAADPPAKMEPIRIARDGKGFVLERSGKKFVPWGFNYDHDANGRLIEDYWVDEWAAIEGDFAEMRQLGA